MKTRFLHGRFHEEIDVQIEDALQTIFRTATIEDGYGHAATGAELLEMVCQHVDTKKALTGEEWVDFVDDPDIDHEVACPGLPDVLQLRHEPMTANDMEALSLNLHQDGSYGYPIVYIKNNFKNLGEVVEDHATGLVWQQSGSEERLTYDEAREYIEDLNRKKFGGYDGWRLPTIEELLSLLGKEKNSDGLYIDPVFDLAQYWCWSADVRQTKGESSRESAWIVDFLFGSVGWNGLCNDAYVRAVRSWQ